MEIFSAVVVILLLILLVLCSINKKLGLLCVRLPNDDISPVHDEHMYDIKNILSEIKVTLEEIKYTTDLIEEYKIPTPSERKSIDQYRIDQEIDEMLSERKS